MREGMNISWENARVEIAAGVGAELLMHFHHRTEDEEVGCTEGESKLSLIKSAWKEASQIWSFGGFHPNNKVGHQVIFKVLFHFSHKG